MGGWRWARACLGPALSVASIAWGQSPAAVELPPVDVPVPAAPPPPESPLVRDPTGLTTLVEVEGRQAEVPTVGSLVAESPGVALQQSGGLGQSEQLTLRGASSTGVLVLLDGVPLNGLGGIADLSLVPLAGLQRVEVLRGGAGARYGAGALGGVVNLVTRSAGDPVVSADLAHGSFASTQGTASVSGPVLDGSGLLELHAGHTDGDFSYTYDPLAGNPASKPQTLVRENNQASWVGGLAKGGGRLGTWRLDGLVQLSAVSRGLAGTVYAPTPDAHQDFLGLQAGLRLSRRFASGADTSIRLDTRREANTFSGPMLAEDTRWWQAALSWDGTLPIGHHWLSASASLGLSFADASTGAPRWAITSVSVQDEWRLAQDRVSIVPSLRLDQAGTFVGLSPKLGASWSLPAGVTLQGNVGQSFRVPSFLELFIPTGTTLVNPDLQPERGVFVDGGVSVSGASGLLRLAGFAAQYQNLIIYELRPPLAARPRNLSAVRAWGLEVEGHLDPASWVQLGGSYTLLFTENIRDVAPYFGKEIPFRPRHRGTARLVLGPERFRLRAALRAQSEMFVDRTNTEALAIGARALVDAGVEVMILRRPQLVLSVTGTNLGDVHTEDFAGYPLPGRAFFASVSLRLDLGRSNTTTMPSVPIEGSP
ncbi:MAG TPA: TonB-dependent receptor [Myxococcaceae bacterium]|nr:TonB-dependent receptor [Myxococcaceae bacterium]